MNMDLVFFGPKNITFHNILNQTYLPVRVCAECPPPGHGLQETLNLEKDLCMIRRVIPIQSFHFVRLFIIYVDLFLFCEYCEGAMSMPLGDRQIDVISQVCQTKRQCTQSKVNLWVARGT